MNRGQVFCVILFLSFQSVSGQISLPDNLQNLPIISQSEDEIPLVSHTYTWNMEEVRSSLRGVNRYRSGESVEGTRLQIFDPYGTSFQVLTWELPVAEEEHYSKYPQNRTYKIGGEGYSGRISVSDKGVTGLIYTPDGSFFIEPNEGGQHISYISAQNRFSDFLCETDDTESPDTDRGDNTRSGMMSGEEMRTYRIAILCTNEFCLERGNNLTTINADINAYLSVMNAMYERELALTFTLVANNDLIVYYNSNDMIDPDAESSPKLQSVHNRITSIIGSANFDIGHAFHEIDFMGSGATGSGVATIGVVCDDTRKGRGWSGAGGTYGADFFMYIFGHEVGHQLGARHSHYGTSGNCGPGRSAGHGYEPGSGNTLMSYEGICGQTGSCTNSHDILPYATTFYLHAHSIQVMNAFIAGTTCFSSAPTGNSPPEISSINTGFTIPKGTPFTLEGSATDPDGDMIFYNWEQFDTDFLILNCPEGEPLDAGSSTTAPLFRSYDPSTLGHTRVFPKLQDILSGAVVAGEVLPQVGRTMTFRLNARDFNANGGGYTFGTSNLTVDDNSGPFNITTANDPVAFMPGESINVTWNVAGTDMAPVSCSHVDILYSTDGGQSFTHILASNTPNDGSQIVTLPNIETSQGRIMIRSVGNIFFDINKANILLTSSCSIAGGSIIFDDPVMTVAGDPSLQLNLISGLAFTEINGEITNDDPSTFLAAELNQGSGNCGFFANSPKYNEILFVPNVTGVYTFTKSSSFFLNMYNGSYNPDSPCQNWIGSGHYVSGSTVFTKPFFNILLTAGIEYRLIVSGFSSTQTLGNYTVSTNNSIGGTLYETGSFPGTGALQTYVISNSSNVIMDISTDPDLSNNMVYGPGSYEIRSLSYYTFEDPTTYIGNTITNLQDDINAQIFCGAFSNNLVDVSLCSTGIKTVTNTSDASVTGSLRYLIENACPDDTIVFDAGLIGSTIICSTEIQIGQNLTIEGLGNDILFLSGGGSTRIFQVLPGIEADISGLTLLNAASAENGGAIWNRGLLTLENITFENNFQGLTPKSLTNDHDVRIKGIVIMR